MTSHNAVAIIGANGFVGQSLSRAFVGAGYGVTGIARKGSVSSCDQSVKVARIDSCNFDASTELTEAFRGSATVVHLAARVHVMQDDAADPFAAFRTTSRLNH
jgi:UDP-glucose 4-epimerase